MSMERSRYINRFRGKNPRILTKAPRFRAMPNRAESLLKRKVKSANSKARADVPAVGSAAPCSAGCSKSARHLAPERPRTLPILVQGRCGDRAQTAAKGVAPSRVDGV